MNELNQAAAALQAGQFEAARAIAERVLAAAPGHEHALQLQAAACMRLGDAATAALIYEGLAARFPAAPALHYNLGLACRDLGDAGRAREAFAAALRLAPGMEVARFEMGLLLLRDRDYAAAAGHFEASRGTEHLRARAQEYAAYCRRFGSPTEHPPASAPRVSVVIPCFNHGEFVGDAVRSVIEQSYRNIEIVVVEGGSTDGVSAEAVRRIRHSRVRTLFQDAPTPAGANRNAGIAATTGTYVCCLDADDTLAPDYIEKAVFCLETLGYDIVGAAAQEFGQDQRRRAFARNPTLADLIESNQFLVPAVHRRDLWVRSGGFVDFDRTQGFIHEDWNYWIRLMALGARALNINWEFLVRVRNHEASRQSRRTDVLPLDRQVAIMLERNRDVLGSNVTAAPAGLAGRERLPGRHTL